VGRALRFVLIELSEAEPRAIRTFSAPKQGRKRERRGRAGVRERIKKRKTGDIKMNNRKKALWAGSALGGISPPRLDQRRSAAPGARSQREIGFFLGPKARGTWNRTRSAPSWRGDMGAKGANGGGGTGGGHQPALCCEQNHSRDFYRAPTMGPGWAPPQFLFGWGGPYSDGLTGRDCP